MQLHVLRVLFNYSCMHIANNIYHVCTDKPMPTAPCLGTQVPRQKPMCLCLAIIILAQSPSIMTTPTLLHTGSVRVLPLNWTYMDL